MRKTILLADDDASIRAMLGRILEIEHSVLVASTGREAVLQFLSPHPPDLVLLDLNMPDKDGWEAWHLIRTFDPLVPVIVITARPNQYAEAMRWGVDALMEKPLDLPLLLQSIRRLLSESDEARLERRNNPEFRTALLASRHRPDTRSAP
jgi:DNA-binding response OmpR family regulator